LNLTPSAVSDLFDEARRTFPKECCGVIVTDGDGQRFVAFDNLADKLHAADPVAHPRDGRTAYAMHPLKLQRLVDAVQAAGGTLDAICHSHPQHPSYFSDTDRRAAAPFGLPTYPTAVQVVVSVFNGEVRDLKGFTWRDDDWHETAVHGVPELPGPPPGAAPLGDV
jgi:proteasome lid subunit RPN8/RPN11